MIQRIQSIYLVLAGLFPAFTYFVPLALFTQISNPQSLGFTINSLYYNALAFPLLADQYPWALIITTIAAIILPIITIFGYKNRKRQIKFINFAMTVNVVWYVAFAIYTVTLQNSTQTNVSFKLGILFPLLAFITLYLAKRAIKHDEALVRAADRIR